MARKIQIKPHLSLEAIQLKIKNIKGFWRVQRWLIIYQAQSVGCQNSKDIAARFGVSKATINCLISAYNRLGEQAIDTPGKAQRQRANLTLEEEALFLKPFLEKSISGEITGILDIKAALEKRLGKIVHQSTVYRLLERHHWRKIEPRPAHPKSSKEARDDFKKNSKAK